MSAETVSNEVEKNRTLTFLDESHLALVSVDNCQGVPTVYSFSVHLVLCDATESYEVAVSHCFASCLTAHTVVVVVEVEDDRQTALVAIFPEFIELVHSCKVHSFEYGTASCGAVACVSNYDTVFLVTLLEESNTCCDGACAANDSVVRENTEGKEECVHGAAETSGEAHILSEKLAHKAVHKVVLCKILNVCSCGVLLNNFVLNTAVVCFHYLCKLFIGKLLDSGHRLSDNFVVGTVCTENEVVNTEVVSLTYSCCFFTETEVRRAGICEFLAVIDTLLLDIHKHFFKFSDCNHIGVHTDKVFLGVVVLFISNCLVVFTYGNIFKCHCALFKAFFRVYKH